MGLTGQYIRFLIASASMEGSGQSVQMHIATDFTSLI